VCDRAGDPRGGKEVEADGKTVVLNSPETVESVKFAIGLWKESCDEGGLAWDDTSNNRAFLSGSISATNNGASIYIEAKRKPESYQTEKGAPMWLDILHARIPKGPGGQFNLPLPFTDMVMGYSKNAGSTRNQCSPNGSPHSKASPTVPPRIGRRTRCGTPIRCCGRFATYHRSGGWRAMPDRLIARPLKW
jgi:hypothetical protein